MRFLAVSLTLFVLPLSSAVLEGVVLENRSGRPLARTKVSLETIRAAGNVEKTEALSDSGGRFRFFGLPSGAYRVKAQRQGYLTTRFGQRRWNGNGSPIALDADSRFFAELRMPRTAAITGEVVDENGVGLAGIAVQAFPAGKRPLRATAYATADDRGMFRMEVEPGAYYVRTGPAQLADGEGLLPTFLGRSVEARDARAVEAGYDEDVAIPAIEPLPGKLGSIAGTVEGGFPATVALYTDTGKREVQAGAGGAFAFNAVAPGAYVLTAEGQDRSAYLRLQVAGATHAVLRLGPDPAVRLRCEGDAPQSELDGISVILSRNPPFGTLAVQVHCGGSAAAEPGEYSASATTQGGAYVESIRGKSEALNAVPGQVLDIILTARAGAAGLKGKVAADGQPAAGARVFLKPLPEGRRLYRAGGDRVAANAEGEYLFTGLPPGRYMVLSSLEILEPTAEDWEAGEVRTVELGEGRTETVNLRPAGGL